MRLIARAAFPSIHGVRRGAVRRSSCAPLRRPLTSGRGRPWSVGDFVLVGLIGVGVGFGATTAIKSKPSPLNPSSFSPYIVEAKEVVSPTSSVFVLKPPAGQAEDAPQDDEIWKKGVWSVEVKQPQLQIARSYTPLPPLSTEHPNVGPSTELSFLIRKADRGEVSGYLHGLPIGAEVELRGPHVDYEIPQGVEEIVFLAGGTGIAPALQVAYCLAKREGARSKMHVLWANRKREDCLGAECNTVQNHSSSESWYSSLSQWFGFGGIRLSIVLAPRQHIRT